MCGIIALKYIKQIDSKNNENNQALRKKVLAIYENQKSRGTMGGGMSIKRKENGKVKYYRARNNDSEEFFQNSKQKFQALKEEDLVLMHHRYPTTNNNGSKTTHPFMNETKDISLVHNGTLHNYWQTQQRLEREGHNFESKTTTGITDSEIILHLFEERLEGKRSDKAIKKSLERLEKELQGSYAIAITLTGSNKIWLATNGNPLEIYSDRYAIYASSELPANYSELGFKIEHSMSKGEIGYMSETGYEQVKEPTKYEIKEYEYEYSNLHYGNNNSRLITYEENENDTTEPLNYSNIPTILDQLREIITETILETKTLSKKKQYKTLTKKLDEILETYIEKINEENQRVEQIIQENEQYIEELGEEIKTRITDYNELEADYAEIRGLTYEYYGTAWED